jgi:hypothetical protein
VEDRRFATDRRDFVDQWQPKGGGLLSPREVSGVSGHREMDDEAARSLR